MSGQGVLQERGGLWCGRRWIFEKLPSTNRWALDNSKLLRNGDAVVARQQTAGRGRFDRIWQSPGTENLTVSFCIDVDPAKPPPSLLPAAAAVAVRNTLFKAGAPATLKWPNDVICCNRKIAGILAEQDSLHENRIILGIGININPAAPIEVENGRLPAVGLHQVDGGCRWGTEQLLSELVIHLELWLKAVQNDPHTLLEEWRKYDALAGRQLSITTAAGRINGSYAGIDGQGRLLLQEETGNISAHWAGDVSISGTIPAGTGLSQ